MASTLANNSRYTGSATFSSRALRAVNQPSSTCSAFLRYGLNPAPAKQKDVIHGKATRFPVSRFRRRIEKRAFRRDRSDLFLDLAEERCFRRFPGSRISTDEIPGARVETLA